MILSKTSLIGAGIIGGVYLLFLTAFCFWFVYLLQLVLQKRNSYKATLRNLESSINSQNISFQVKTDFVKYLFLFVMNIVEVLSITIAVVPTTIRSIFLEPNNINNSIINEMHLHKINVLFLQSSKGLLNPYEIRFLVYTSTLALNLFILSISLMTSLCVYLSARYARKSWIKSTNIRYYLGITIVFIVINQVCTLLSCIFTVTMEIMHFIFETVLFVSMVKQSRRLKMIVNWTIVDLNISKTNRTLCKRLKRRQKRFVKLLHSLWIGVFLIVVSDFLSTVAFVGLTDWNSIHEHRDTCMVQNNNITAYVTTPIIMASNLIFIIGITLILLPYIAVGLYTMVIVLWRCAKGKTGYRTKFRNPLLK